MKKIISLFQRNYEGDRLVRDEIVPGAEWVINGEGIATRKWDGTSCLIRNGKLFKRYDAKKGKQPPGNFEPAQPEPDPVSGHWPGWLPVGDGPEDKYYREAFETLLKEKGEIFFAGFEWTYELCGPKIGNKGDGNPENLISHILIPHGSKWLDDVPRTFEGIKEYLSNRCIEGIVWWRDVDDLNCDKVKIKARDFGLPWPRK